MSTFRISLLTSVVLVIVLLHIARMEVAAKECYSNFDCPGSYDSSSDIYCCRGYTYYYGTRSCSEDCVGYSCTSSTDCAPGECCDDDKKCRDDCFNAGLAGGIIAAIIIGAIIVIAIPVAIIVCCCCCGAAAASASRRPVNSGVVLAQPGAGVTLVTSQNTQSMGYPVASYPNAPVYPVPLQNPAAPYNPYLQKPGQNLPAQGPPPAYNTQ